MNDFQVLTFTSYHNWKVVRDPKKPSETYVECVRYPGIKLEMWSITTEYEHPPKQIAEFTIPKDTAKIIYDLARGPLRQFDKGRPIWTDDVLVYKVCSTKVIIKTEKIIHDIGHLGITPKIFGMFPDQHLLVMEYIPTAYDAKSHYQAEIMGHMCHIVDATEETINKEGYSLGWNTNTSNFILDVRDGKWKVIDYEFWEKIE